MPVGRPLLETGEEKEDRSLVSSHSLFSLQGNSLLEMCMNNLLSNESRFDKEYLKQSLGLLYDPYNELKQKKLKQQKLKRLIEAILRGDRETTLEMIEKDPGLLLEKLEDKLKLHGIEIEGEVAEAPSGHKTTNTTAYRVALAVEDTQLAAEIKAKLINIAGEEAAEAQWHEQFPKGWEETEEKAYKPLFDQLKLVTRAIQDAEEGDIISFRDPDYRLMVRKRSKVGKALATFRSLLDSRLDEVITTGRQFNPQLLLTACEIYNDRHYFGNWSAQNPRRLLFWQRVIGYIQRSLPANYIQAFCGGSPNTEENLLTGNPQGRSLKFDLIPAYSNKWTSIPCYPLSKSRLGFDFALSAQRGCGMGNPFSAATHASNFQRLCQLKTAGIQNLCGMKSLTDAPAQRSSCSMR